jgi:pimeloyl-ACP methyl ester carboxylesterase
MVTTIAATATVEDRLVMLRGLRFHYRDWPNEGAPMLVLLHGYTGHARSWDSFASAMQPDFRVIALDQRGHGESGWADDYSPERMVEDIEAFVTALGLGRFSLLGLSMGGRNAYHYAARRPETLEALVIVDIGPELIASGMERIRTGVLMPDVFDSSEDAFLASRAENPIPPEDELRHRVYNNLMQTEDGRWTFRWDKAMRAPERPIQRPDAEQQWALLPKITCPTLIVRGEISYLFARDVAERMVREIPDARLVEVAGASHSVPLDQPEGFLEAVRPFLQEQSQRR